MNTFAKYGNKVGKELAKERSWALVTGASDGIGLQYSHELARRGFNIILLSRTQSKLDKCAQEIKGVETLIIAHDLSKVIDAESAKELVDKIPEDLDLALLVNNAGYAHEGTIEEIEASDCEGMININSLAPFYLTKALLPRLMQRKQRSGILNVSSVASINPIPGLVTYCCTKVFLTFFSQGLNFEMKIQGENVDVLDYTPAYVSTNMSRLKPNSFVIRAKEAAYYSLDDLGQTKHTYGCLMHHITAWASAFSFANFPTLVGKSVMKDMQKIAAKKRANRNK